MLIPNAPLVTILVATQVLNAVLLVPLLIVMVNIGRDRDLMGRFTIGLAQRSPTGPRPPWWWDASRRWRLLGQPLNRISHSGRRLSR